VEFMIVIAILALVEVLAATGAADSRDGNDWVNHGRV
jgi:Tfp pilus assembly protein FimT